MFSRISTSICFAFFAFTLLAAASPQPWTSGQATTVTVTATAPATTVTEPASQCNTGPVQCCNTVESATDPGASLLLGLLGIVLSDLDVLLGLGCDPITVIGIGSGASCSAQAVCCENNNFNGLINIGCTPVNLSL